MCINICINMDIVYFEINHKNKLIYVLLSMTLMEVKNNKMLFLIQEIEMLLWCLTICGTYRISFTL